MQIWSDAYKQQNVLNYKAHVIPLVSAFSQRFHFEGNFLLKGIFCKMKEI